MEENYLKNKRQAARHMGISLGSLERLMREGLPYVRIGALIRFRPEDLAAFIEQRRHIGGEHAGGAESRPAEVRQ